MNYGNFQMNITKSFMRKLVKIKETEKYQYIFQICLSYEIELAATKFRISSETVFLQPIVESRYLYKYVLKKT